VALLVAFAGPALGPAFHLVLGERRQGCHAHHTSALHPCPALAPTPLPHTLLDALALPIAVGAVAVGAAELCCVSLVIRARHRVARSALGRLYGFAFDCFSSMPGIIAMALQRTFAGGWLRRGLACLSLDRCCLSAAAVSSVQCPARAPPPPPPDSYAVLADNYFGSALVLAVWMGTHQAFLEALFSAGVTGGGRGYV
jgi:hypothetical protein